jgi:hypothetical protein
MERTKEFKEFEEFKELASKIPSGFVALDSAMSRSLQQISVIRRPEAKFASLNSSKLLNSLNSFSCVLNCGVSII